MSPLNDNGVTTQASKNAPRNAAHKSRFLRDFHSHVGKSKVTKRLVNRRHRAAAKRGLQA